MQNLQNELSSLGVLQEKINSNTKISQYDVMVTSSELLTKTQNAKIQKYKTNQKCFVLMPFKKHLKPVYDKHICKVCKKLNFPVTRADQIFSINPIIEDILQAVKDSNIIIADLTDNNPNVFYEIGICHTLKKQVVLITQNDHVPFDLSHIRRIRYEYTSQGMKAFEESLSNTLKAIS